MMTNDKYSKYEDGMVAITQEWTQEEFESAKRELADSLIEHGATLKESIQLMGGLTNPNDLLAAIRTIDIMYPHKIESGQSPPKSVVRQGGSSSGEWVFNSVKQGISTLYELEAKGDKEAHNKLERLRRKLELSLRANPDISFSISGCPKCNSAITPDMEVCDVCGFRLKEDFTDKGGELLW